VSSGWTRSSPWTRSPIGRTETHIGLLDKIVRDLYSKSRRRGRGPPRPPFLQLVNEAGAARCAAATARFKIENGRLLPCRSSGHGERYNRETLGPLQGKTIADVLEMPVEEALEFFATFPRSSVVSGGFTDVGLDYIPARPTRHALSGGEAQRVKLAAEAVQGGRPGRRSTSSTEPTTGAALRDIQRLLGGAAAARGRPATASW